MGILNCHSYLERFLMIQTKDGRMQQLKLNPPQERLYRTIAEQWNAGKPVRIIILKARQMGFSTLTEAILFWLCATHTNTETMVVAHTEEATAALFNMSRRYYDYLPDIMKPMTQASNAREIIFDRPSKSRVQVKGLGSRLRCTTAGGKGAGRGYTLRGLHLSEYAFWPGDKQATYTGLAQTVPDRPGTLIIIESTANGYDSFKEMWDKAVQAEREGTDGFTPIFFAWHEMPEYRREPAPGFTRTADEEKLAEEYGLDDRQMAWRRWAIANNCGGSEDMFRQEYPSCPDEAFLATGACFFGTEGQRLLVLRRNQVVSEHWERGSFRVRLDEAERITGYSWEPEKDGPVYIRRQPEDGVPYVIGGDTAGEGSDMFVGQVLDNRTGEQVAKLWHRLGEREYAQQMYCLGMHYNTALIGIETNYSTYPEKKLEELGYPRLYVRERVDTYTGAVQQTFGFATTSKSRPLALDTLKDVLLHEPDMITDYETMGEMLTFVYNDNWRPEAEEGKHDDLVLALAIAHAIRGQQTTQARNDEKESFWTQDMWDDYNNAGPGTRAELIRRWGKPRRR